jgi:hypothetical protein
VVSQGAQLLAGRIEKLLRESGERFRADPLAARAVAAVHPRRGDLAGSLFASVRRENSDFLCSKDPHIPKEGIDHARAILETMVAIALGRSDELGSDPFSFIRAHGARRARQQFPLTALLHAYRLGHKGILEAMRAQVLAHSATRDQAMAALMIVSDFLMDYADVTAMVLTESYLAEEKLLSAERTRTRAAVLEDLIHGLPPRDDAGRELSERCGIGRGGRLALACARLLPEGALRFDRAAALRALAAIVERALPDRGIGRIVDTRDGAVIGIFCGEAEITPALAAALAAGLSSWTGGWTARIGIGRAVARIEQLPEAHEEAERACDFADKARPVVEFAGIDLVEFLRRRPNAAAFRLIPDWADRFLAADRDKTGALAHTIEAFAASSLNVKRAARRLGVHTNTLYFRLNRIEALTGVDPRSFAGLSLLLTTLKLAEARARAATAGLAAD